MKQKVRENEEERKICQHCRRRHIHPGTSEEEYLQEEQCRNQEWLDMEAERLSFYDNWL